MQLQLMAPFLLQELHVSPKKGISIAIGAIGISAALRALYCLIYGVCNKSDVDIPVSFFYFITAKK